MKLKPVGHERVLPDPINNQNIKRETSEVIRQSLQETFQVRAPSDNTLKQKKFIEKNTILSPTFKNSNKQAQLGKKMFPSHFNINPIIEKAKVSVQPPNVQLGNLIAYAANTHNGIVRNYNEDRISIVLDLKNPRHKQMNGEKRI